MWYKLTYEYISKKRNQPVRSNGVFPGENEEEALRNALNKLKLVYPNQPLNVLKVEVWNPRQLDILDVK